MFRLRKKSVQDTVKKDDILDFMTNYFKLCTRGGFRIISFCSGPVFIFEYLLAVVLVLKAPAQNLRRYGPRYAVPLYAWYLSVFWVINRKNITTIHEWAWAKASLFTDIKARQHLIITKTVKSMKMICLCCNILSVVAVLIWMVPLGDDAIFAIEDVARPYFEEHMLYIQVFYRTTIIFGSYVLTVVAYSALYWPFFTKILHIMFLRTIEDIKDISRRFEALDAEHNQEYQTLIENKLKESAAIHLTVSSTVRRLSKHFGKDIAMFAVIAILSGSCTLYHIILQEPTMSAGYLLQLGLVGFGVLLLGLLTVAGQTFVDVGESMHAEMCDLPWYSFNIRNRKMLLFILTQTIERMEYCFCSTIVVDLKMFIQVPKIMFSLSTLIAARTQIFDKSN